MQISNNNEKKKHNNNYKTQMQLKTTYPFIKGIPPASNWSNHFTSLIFPGGKYLLYISNSFIVVLDLVQKKFSQILSSNKIYQKEKPNILLLLNKEKFLSIINSGEIIIFGLNSEGNFIEDLKSNKCDKICQNVKCGVLDYEQSLLILSNDNRIYAYNIEYEDYYNVSLMYEISNINEINYFITDMLLIKIDSNNYLVVSNNIGNIIIYKYNSIRYDKILVININKKENIYNIIYDKISNTIYSISKSGTLNAYQLILSDKNNLIYNNTLNLQNKFNDQAINEFYLFFSIFFIHENNLLITSNQGRIFLYNIKNKQVQEIAENPHKNSIYSILHNYDLNQIIFFSSDYKISLFDIKLSKDNSPLINFAYCINTIPSKPKLVGQCNNKIYYLFQIQHKLYVNSYDIKKEKNYLDSIQNKVRIKYNYNINNNKENESNNYNLSLCKLIDEERCLLVNKKNEIIIYNLEDEITEVVISFLEKEELIVDILFNEDILYILYKTGKIIIYNTNTKKIEKYKISNLIDKGNLLYLQNDIITLIIKENKSELVQFYLLKNYIFIKIKEINALNDFFLYEYILPNLNLFYFYVTDVDLTIYYMNLFKQYEILKDIDTKEIKYEQYLNIINKLKNSMSIINEKKYEFDSIFKRNDFNKCNLKITNISINDKLNMICSFNDGSVMYYLLDIDTKNQNNYIINKIIYKYLIKVNFLPINDALFLNNINNEKENNFYFVTTSAEQSLKITDPSNCNILNINFFPKNNTNIINQITNTNYIINKSFTNLFSNFFFTQSGKDVKIFSENFSIPENIYNSSIETLLFSYFKEEEKNLLSNKKIIEYAMNKNKNKKQDSEYIDEICDYFLQKEGKNKLIFCEEKNWEEIIDYLIESFCYVECLLYIKYKNLGVNAFIQCLEKIKKSIYLKQMIQAIKIEKIIQYYKNNFNDIIFK